MIYRGPSYQVGAAAAERGPAFYRVCAACHGEDGAGNPDTQAPRLAGQYPWYLERQLRNFRAGIRGADSADVNGFMMRPMAVGLPDDQAVTDVGRPAKVPRHRDVNRRLQRRATMTVRIDRSNMKISRRGFQFQPFRPTGDGGPLASANLADDEELLVFGREQQHRALIMRQMIYHHVAQGELAGEPYLVTF